MTAAAQLPFISVVIRSYNRLDACAELLRAVLDQDYPTFEVVIVEQSTVDDDLGRDALRQLATDPRVQLIEVSPLGPAGARNAGWRAARGDVVLFMDDDDLPVGRGWIRAHAVNYQDPTIVAVSGREIWSLDEDPTPHNNRKNYQLCLSYSFLRMPHTRVRHTRRLENVSSLRSGNGSIRREIITRVGGWDERVPSRDENSFDFKFMKLKTPDERIVYDPRALMLRRLEIEGGIDRRQATPEQLLEHELTYSHIIIRRYFPARFALCYPIYLYIAMRETVQFQRKHTIAPRTPSIIINTARALLPTLARTWRQALRG